MQLAPATTPARTPAPIRVLAQLTTATDGYGTGTSDQRAERVLATFGPATRVEASERTYDPLWDGPYAQPARPSDWSRPATTPAAGSWLAAATTALRDAVLGADLASLPAPVTQHGDYATFHVSYADRPVGLDHLRPWQERDGSWTVYLRTSMNTLLDEPRLQPLVDAARRVLAAAR